VPRLPLAATDAMMPSSALLATAVVAGVFAAQSAADAGAPGRFLAPRNTTNDTASPYVNRSASREEDLRADAAASGGCCGAPPMGGGCASHAFCSPVSKRCYGTRSKPYYQSCSAPADQSLACCAGCSGSAFCSPVSGTCYAWKNKDYYHTCAPKKNCCAGCSGSAFCSPVSGTCYAWKNKDYYQPCQR